MMFLKILIIICIVITGGIMLGGVLSMSKSGEFNRKYGNKLMQARVIAQGVTLVLIAVYLLLYA